MIYIVIRDIGIYEDREVFNEAVFDTKEKAVNYILGKGYIWNQNDEVYEEPGRGFIPELYRIEYWEINTILED